jgi:hypothetical protein
MKKPICFIYLSLLFLFGTSGCEASLSSSASTSTIENPTACPDLQGISQAPEGKYLFVQKWIKEEGTGRGFSWGPDRTHYYIFNPVSRILNTNCLKEKFKFEPTTWGFMGNVYSAYGNTGGQIRGVLDLIQAFPNKTEIEVFTGKVDGRLEDFISIPVELLAVTAEGVLLVEIEGRCMVLAPNESWSRVVEADVANEAANGHLIITSSVTNYGWIDIANIKYSQ